MDSLRRLRLAKGLSQRGLARQAGVSQASLSEIEAGKTNPTVRILQKIARALGVPLSALLEDDGGEAPEKAS